MNKLTTEEFIQKAILKHRDKYDYSLVNYKHNAIKINIICPIHGKFKQTPTCHLITSGCQKCGQIQKVSKRFLTQE